MYNKDKEFIWHPFTQIKNAFDNILIKSAKDTVLYTHDGKEIIDAISSWWVNLHGHAHPYIAKKISEQLCVLEHVIFSGFTHEPAINLAEAILKLLPNIFTKVFYSDNGSTSVEVALKIAIQYYHNQGQKNKKKIIAFENAYHGDTFGAMSIGGRGVFNAPFNDLLFEVEFIPVPNKDNIKKVKEKINSLIFKGNIAAFIYEPLVQGAAGMIIYDSQLLDEILDIFKKKNIICIADEVMTGFGRTGKMFASDYLANKSDIICLSKGITGGFLPLGVTVCTENIYKMFYSSDKTKTFYHGHSYTANPIACTAANASIELLNSTDCKKQIEFIALQHKKFKDKMASNKLVKSISQIGTILSIEIKTQENTSYFNSIRDIIYYFCLENGVLLRPLGNVIYVLPPYCINEQQLNKVYNTIEMVLEHINKLK